MRQFLKGSKFSNDSDQKIIFWLTDTSLLKANSDAPSIKSQTTHVVLRGEKDSVVSVAVNLCYQDQSGFLSLGKKTKRCSLFSRLAVLELSVTLHDHQQMEIKKIEVCFSVIQSCKAHLLMKIIELKAPWQTLNGPCGDWYEMFCKSFCTQ